MSLIFLDCGTHFGEGIRDFIKKLNITKDWQTYTFEANPKTYEEFLNTNKELIEEFNIKHYNKAVYNKDGNITFHQQNNPEYNEPYMGGGSTLLDLSKWNPGNSVKLGHFETSVEVECFDFSKVVSKLKGNKIFVKMDIEGAEYDVLEKMIQDDTLKYIDTIFIEFHLDFVTDKEITQQRQNNIINKIYENGVNLHLWH
jgi:FkbM family methyltransferase